jgi:hypothetical protein
MIEQDIWDFLETEPRWAKETKKLYEWSLNCESVPFQKFLDLIGYSEDYVIADWTTPSKALGYKELGHLANALNEYADNPREIEEYVHQLLQAEAN